METFFLAMATYPEVQKRAQAEIDAVVGSHRLPDYDDRPSLPYINAIIKESMRWHLALPLCASLLSSSSPSVPSWRIMKLFPTWLLTMMSTMVIIFPKERSCSLIHGQYETINCALLCFFDCSLLLRTILHDPKVFKDPMEFQPERYLKDGKINPDILDSDSVAFGYGRRWVIYIQTHIFFLRYYKCNLTLSIFLPTEFVPEDT